MSKLVHFYSHNSGLLVSKTLGHLAICALAMAVALVLALPAGVYLGHRHRGSVLAVNIANVLRAIPSLALIAIGFDLLGLSPVNVQVALVALAIPPILTNALTAVGNVDPDAVESARGMGMNERQILTRIELPLSWPLIFAGIRSASVFVIATATLAGLAGGGGLGNIVLNQPDYHLSGLIGATLVICVLAFVLDALLAALQRLLTPRGLSIAPQLKTLMPPTMSTGANPLGPKAVKAATVPPEPAP
ncbi:MAG: ABC transporter permease [Actinomycetota bacterium]|nr:ABC transporter permease [Actinomycetota bacterium]